MRWWAGWWAVTGVVLLAACGGSGGGSGGGSPGPSDGGAASVTAAPPSTSPAAGPSRSPSTSASTSASAEPSQGDSSVPATGSAAPLASCFAGRVEVTVSPGDAVERRLCVRAGAVVSVTLRPRADDRRWTAVRSSAPGLVLASGWRTDADGTAHATLRCATVRAGTAVITVAAKAPDVAGAARTAFTLRVSVLPYAKEE